MKKRMIVVILVIVMIILFMGCMETSSHYIVNSNSLSDFTSEELFEELESREGYDYIVNRIMDYYTDEEFADSFIDLGNLLECKGIIDIHVIADEVLFDELYDDYRLLAKIMDDIGYGRSMAMYDYFLDKKTNTIHKTEKDKCFFSVNMSNYKMIELTQDSQVKEFSENNNLQLCQDCFIQ